MKTHRVIVFVFCVRLSKKIQDVELESMAENEILVHRQRGPLVPPRKKYIHYPTTRPNPSPVKIIFYCIFFLLSLFPRSSISR